MDFEHETDRKAPKKMGRSAMRTRLPYASAVPSGVATNFTVALSASVPLESVAFRASRTAEASEAGTCSASDMLVQRPGFGEDQLLERCAETDGRVEVEAEAVWFSFRGRCRRCCRGPVKATFPKDAIREANTAKSAHPAAVSPRPKFFFVCHK